MTDKAKALELLSALHEAMGNGPAVFTLRTVGAAGTVFKKQTDLLEAALRSSRDEALEEAAKVAEQLAEHGVSTEQNPLGAEFNRIAAIALSDAAAAIRNLKAQPDG